MRFQQALRKARRIALENWLTSDNDVYEIDPNWVLYIYRVNYDGTDFVQAKLCPVVNGEADFSNGFVVELDYRR